MGVAAFWIALAAVIIAGEWNKRLKEQMRHETIRLLIEKGERLDEKQLRELLNPPPPKPPVPPAVMDVWSSRSTWYPPGQPRSYTQFRIAGTIFTIAGPGVAAMIAGIGYASGSGEALLAGLGIGVFVSLLGLAFFVVSRFFVRTDGPQDESTQET